jgi:hypothetical protein
MAIVALAPAMAVDFNLTVPDTVGSYKIFGDNGSVVKSGDFNNSVSLSLPEGTYYLLLNTEKNSIFASFTVDVDTTSVTIDPATLYSLTVNATLTNETPSISSVSTDVTVSPTANANVTWTFATNWTVLFADDLKLTFANTTRQLIYKFVLEKVEVNGAEVNLTDTSYNFTADKDYTVVLYYKPEYVISPTYMMLIVALVAIGLIAIIVTGGKKAKQTILNKEVEDFKFFRRVR